MKAPVQGLLFKQLSFYEIPGLSRRSTLNQKTKKYEILF